MDATVQLNTMIGIRSGASNSLSYIDEGELQFVSGRNVVRYDAVTRAQKIFPGSLNAVCITALAVTPNRSQTAVAELGTDGHSIITVFDWSNKKRRRVIHGVDVSGPVTHMSFSADGKMLLIITGAPYWSLFYIAWEKGPNGKLIASLRNVTTRGKRVHEISVSPHDIGEVLILGANVAKVCKIQGDTFKVVNLKLRKENQDIVGHFWASSQRLVLLSSLCEVLVLESSELKRTMDPPYGVAAAASFLLPYGHGFLVAVVGGLLHLYEPAEDSRNTYVVRRTFRIPPLPTPAPLVAARSHLQQQMQQQMNEGDAAPTSSPKSPFRPDFLTLPFTPSLSSPRPTLSSTPLSAPANPAPVVVTAMASTPTCDEFAVLLADGRALKLRAGAHDLLLGSAGGCTGARAQALVTKTSLDCHLTQLAYPSPTPRSSSPHYTQPHGHSRAFSQISAGTPVNELSLSPRAGGDRNGPFSSGSFYGAPVVLVDQESEDDAAASNPAEQDHALDTPFELLLPAGHAAAVTSVASCSASPLVVTGSADGVVRLWNLTGTSGSDLEAAFSSFSAHSASADAGAAAGGPAGVADTLGPNSLYSLWGVSAGAESTPQLEHELQLPSAPLDLALDPLGMLLAVASADGCELFSVATGAIHRLLSTGLRSARKVSFSPDGALLAVASASQVFVYRSFSFETMCVIRGHSDTVCLLSWCRDSRSLFIASEDGQVSLWPVVVSPQRLDIWDNDSSVAKRPGSRPHSHSQGTAKASSNSMGGGTNKIGSVELGQNVRILSLTAGNDAHGRDAFVAALTPSRNATNAPGSVANGLKSPRLSGALLSPGSARSVSGFHPADDEKSLTVAGSSVAPGAAANAAAASAIVDPVIEHDSEVRAVLYHLDLTKPREQQVIAELPLDHSPSTALAAIASASPVELSALVAGQASANDTVTKFWTQLLWDSGCEMLALSIKGPTADSGSSEDAMATAGPLLSAPLSPSASGLEVDLTSSTPRLRSVHSQFQLAGESAVLSRAPSLLSVAAGPNQTQSLVPNPMGNIFSQFNLQESSTRLEPEGTGCLRLFAPSALVPGASAPKKVPLATATSISTNNNITLSKNSGASQAVSNNANWTDNVCHGASVTCVHVVSTPNQLPVRFLIVGAADGSLSFWTQQERRRAGGSGAAAAAALALSNSNAAASSGAGASARPGVASLTLWQETLRIPRQDLEQLAQQRELLERQLSSVMRAHHAQQRVRLAQSRRIVRTRQAELSARLLSEQTRLAELESELHAHQQYSRAQLADVRAAGARNLAEIQQQLSQRIASEQARLASLAQERAALEQQHVVAEETLRKQHAETEAALRAEFEALLAAENARRAELEAEHSRLVRENSTRTRQLEELVDREITKIHLACETTLQAEAKATLLVKMENGLLKHKFLVSNRELAEQKDELAALVEKEKELLDTLAALQKDVAGHMKEIQERVDTLADKDIRTFDLRRKNQELEKFKFVLNYKIQELKRQIVPRKREIAEMRLQLKEMEKELLQYHRYSASLNLAITELNVKCTGTSKAVLHLKKEVTEKADALEAISRDIRAVDSSSRDLRSLEVYMLRLFSKYIHNAKVSLLDENADSSEFKDAAGATAFVSLTQSLRNSPSKELNTSRDNKDSKESLGRIAQITQDTKEAQDRLKKIKAKKFASITNSDSGPVSIEKLLIDGPNGSKILPPGMDIEGLQIENLKARQYAEHTVVTLRARLDREARAFENDKARLAREYSELTDEANRLKRELHNLTMTTNQSNQPGNTSATVMSSK